MAEKQPPKNIKNVEIPAIGEINSPLNVMSRNSAVKAESAHENRFPATLSPERSMIIAVYDTSKDDPNKDFINNTDVIAKKASKNLSDLIKAVDKTAQPGVANTLIGAAETAYTLTKGAVNLAAGLLTGGLSALGTVTSSAEDVIKKFADTKNFGNPDLTKTPEYKDAIYLPLPNEISEQLSHQYNNENVGVFQHGDILEGQVGGITTVSNLISKATGKQALVFNKNKLAMYESTDFRSITLTWTLVPNNMSESNTIQAILLKLKAYSSPQAVNGKLFLRAPFFLRLYFPNIIIDDALQFKDCVITNIEVNYSSNSNMETFTDNMPKVMNLSVTFQDREPKTLQAWSEPDKDYDEAASNKEEKKEDTVHQKNTSVVNKTTAASRFQQSDQAGGRSRADAAYFKTTDNKVDVRTNPRS